MRASVERLHRRGGKVARGDSRASLTAKVPLPRFGGAGTSSRMLPGAQRRH